MSTNTCRNCGQSITRRFESERWVSSEDGDRCRKAAEDRNAPHGAVTVNAIHAAAC